MLTKQLFNNLKFKKKMEEIKKDEKDVISEITSEMFEELKREKKLNVNELKTELAAKRNIVLRLMEKMLGKLLFKLKIKIVVSWGDTELFTYVIPKN